ncbi:MAG: peptidylprolyl isomerase, partial [Bacteroidetes bacterium]
EGIAMMRKGGKAVMVIPSDLAYGPQGNRGIPPSSTLVFEVELIDIVK